MDRTGFKTRSARKASSTMLPSNKTVAMLICFCKLKLAMLTLPPGSSDWSTVLKLTLMSGTTCQSWNSFNLKEHSTFFGNRLILSGAMIWRSACLGRGLLPLLHSWYGSKVPWLLCWNESIVPSHVSLKNHNLKFSVGLSTRCNYGRVKL